jgi:hypothetical protein
MSYELTLRIVATEAKSAFLETLRDGVFIALAFSVGLAALAAGLAFLVLPALVAAYFNIMPEFTGYTLFQNWVTTSTVFWSAFWLVAGYRLQNKLSIIRDMKGKPKC